MGGFSWLEFLRGEKKVKEKKKLGQTNFLRQRRVHLFWSKPEILQPRKSAPNFDAHEIFSEAFGLGSSGKPEAQEVASDDSKKAPSMCLSSVEGNHPSPAARHQHKQHRVLVAMNWLKWTPSKSTSDSHPIKFCENTLLVFDSLETIPLICG